MSAIVLSSLKRFIDMSHKLEELGLRNIHFFNSQNNELSTPMMALVPFVDMLVLGKDANCFSYFDRLVNAVMDRHIPVISEDCIGEIER